MHTDKQASAASTPGFFDAEQRATISAAMARIIPSDDTPGATEAGAIDFLDRYLAGVDHIYAKPDGSGFETLTGRSADAWRKRIEIMRATYVAGIRELDSRAVSRFGKAFRDLAPAQQDDVLQALEAGEPWPPSTLSPAYALASPASGGPALQQTSTEVELTFFPLLVVHTRQGFLADPIYGGNRNRVGWEAIGFPGPASLADVHDGTYSALAWFAEGHTDADPEQRRLHRGA